MAKGRWCAEAGQESVVLSASFCWYGSGWIYIYIYIWCPQPQISAIFGITTGPLKWIIQHSTRNGPMSWISPQLHQHLWRQAASGLDGVECGLGHRRAGAGWKQTRNEAVATPMKHCIFCAYGEGDSFQWEVKLLHRTSWMLWFSNQPQFGRQDKERREEDAGGTQLLIWGLSMAWSMLAPADMDLEPIWYCRYPEACGPKTSPSTVNLTHACRTAMTLKLRHGFLTP